eukprot:GSChrysophyteH1.ASY1.ANO1.743.1 assembled CDS
MDANEPGLACPSCSREFEIPQKCVRPDDMEFLPVPRLLKCLHTMCQSCLEEMRGRNDSNKVLCPICRTESEIKGVAYLPLDVSILKSILSSSKADVMSYCNRCYDEVPSYSWCPVCSVALCEFHHQDHKLSVDTSKHGLQTFKEIAHQRIHIEPRLPAVMCPEIDRADCTAYCHECKHVVSTHGALQNHSDHRTEDCLHGYNEMRAKLHTALDRSKQATGELKVATRRVRGRLQELDRECERATRQIEDEFDSLRKLLNQRESALMERLGVLSDRKRSILTAQLRKFSEYLDEGQSAIDVSETVLRDTDDMRTTSQDAAYLVGVADTIFDKVENLDKRVKGADLSPQSDADIAVSFNISELSAVELNVPLLGCIQTAEDPQSMAKDDLVEPEIGLLHSRHPQLQPHKQNRLQSHAPSISFSIKSEPPQQIKGEGDLLGNIGFSPSKNNAAASKGSLTQSVVIEARSTEAIVREGLASNAKGHGQGELLGQVILTTEMDKKLAVRNEVRSFFESVVIRNVPIMKITKEFLPSTNFTRSSPDRDWHERGRLDGRDRSTERNDRDRSSSFERNHYSYSDAKYDDNHENNMYAQKLFQEQQEQQEQEQQQQQQQQQLEQQRYQPHTPPRNEQYHDEGKHGSSPDPVGGMDLRRHNDYLAHANDKVKRHGQHIRYGRESNYGMQGGD